MAENCKKYLVVFQNIKIAQCKHLVLIGVLLIKATAIILSTLVGKSNTYTISKSSNFLTGAIDIFVFITLFSIR